MPAQYRCGQLGRRLAVRDASPPTLNGIDYLEVGDDQQTLEVHFIHPLPGSGAGSVPASPPAPLLKPENVVVEGGVRITGIDVTSLSVAGNVLTVLVDAPGDFSTYTLRLRRSAVDDAPPAKFDPQLSQVDFSFKVDCPQDFDCESPLRCPPEEREAPEIDYLAKDYDSFRTLMLDRMAAIAPAWRERNPADGTVALVELLAYVGDHLSYFQDAVATEAYLGTARKRISVRRHARLLDYFVHSGCNARAWIALTLAPGSGADGETIPPGTRFLTRGETDDPRVLPADLDRVLRLERPVVFEAMHSLTLSGAASEIDFHTWSDDDCCLPAGSTQATLVAKAGLALAEGDYVLFEEVASAEGVAADADRTHRHVVRLVSATPAKDELDGTDIVEIAWDAADALPFPLCVTTLPEGQVTPVRTAVARANVLLADHGLLGDVEPLVPDTVPAGRPYRPQLASGPLTFEAPFDRSAPAAQAFGFAARDALPSVDVTGEGTSWTPVFDLLGSDRFEPDVAVELESDGIAHLRFGDDERGRKPQEGATFTAVYRVGNGVAGNVGAEAIGRAVVAFDGLESVRNPLAAAGGTDPEPLERVRQDAPEAFRRQERAVTEADYAEVTERDPDVQRAAATFRWTGSWYTAFVTVDRTGGRPLDPRFRGDLLRFLDRYRMAGQDVELEPPVMVPLDLALDVCVAPGYFRANVEQGVLERLSSGVTPEGRRGFFHPDNFTFGQPVYLSQIYAAASDVAGVRWVQATVFQRFGKAASGELAREVLAPGPFEVARLDNDPNFPENGRLELALEGGM